MFNCPCFQNSVGLVSNTLWNLRGERADGLHQNASSLLDRFDNARFRYKLQCLILELKGMAIAKSRHHYSAGVCLCC